jgi:hypothetical protein
MAAAQRQYTATFAIGARLLGSFRGVMSAAQTRLRSLQRTAASISGALKGVAFGLLGIGTLLSGIAIGHLFAQAAEDATKLNQQTRSLTASLMQFTGVRKRGAAYADAQVKQMLAMNEHLASQGVLSRKIYNELSVGLTLWGVPAKQTQAAVGALADLLVARKGVNASEEDAAQLAKNIGYSIKTAQMRGLKAFGIGMDVNERKMFKQLSMQQRYNYLLKIAKGFSGEAAKAMGSPEGRIQKLKNYLEELRISFGQGTLLPMEAKFADNIRISLQELIRFMHGSAVKAAFSDLAASWRYMSSLVGPELLKIFHALGVAGKDWKAVMGDALVKTIRALADSLKWVGDNAKTLVPLVLALAAAVTLLAIALSPISLSVVAIGGLIYGIVELKKHWDELLQRQDAWGGMARGIQSASDATRNFLLWAGATAWTNFMQAWKDLSANLDKFDKGLRALLAIAFGNFIQGWIDLAHNIDLAWEAVKRVATAMSSLQMPSWLGGGLSPAEQQNAARANAGLAPAARGAAKPPVGALPGMQMGGLVRGLTLSWLGEHGPEMVIPMGGGRRTQGLLDYANRAISGQPRGGTMVTFSPTVTIHGNATETEQRAMDTRLRDLAQDFIAQFKAAQSQERRLSFQSGYA